MTLDNWDTVLDAYQVSRKVNADAISSLALSNFIEMRDLVADEKFLLQKRIEGLLNKRYPDKWIPLYTMVTFEDNTSYSNAKRTGEIQNQVMKEMMAEKNFSDNPNEFDFERAIKKLTELSRD